MRSIGFYVVAAGNQPSAANQDYVVSKLYGYSEGYAQNTSITAPVYYLVELKLSSWVHSSNDQISTIECVSKCTKREYAANFVAELNLGCLFDLLDSGEEEVMY